MTEEEIMKLWALQQAFRSRVMASKRLMKAARSQLKELLSAARWSIHESLHVTDDSDSEDKRSNAVHGLGRRQLLTDESDMWRHIIERQGWMLTSCELCICREELKEDFSFKHPEHGSGQEWKEAAAGYCKAMDRNSGLSISARYGHIRSGDLHLTLMCTNIKQSGSSLMNKLGSDGQH